MKRLLALDPGKTTGMSIWMYDAETPLELAGYGQIEGGVEGFLEYLYPQDRRYMPWDVIVSESFVLDGRTPNPDITPLKIEGILEAHAHRTGTLVRFQRNNFKAHVDNDKLKEFGFYVKGKPHAMDSMRHALAWAKTSYHRPTLDAYFKVEEG
jgi:hypothetical protein